MDRINKIEKFLDENDLKGWQAFDSRNIVGDEMETIYQEDGVTIDICRFYGYLEIFGLSFEELNILAEDGYIC